MKLSLLISYAYLAKNSAIRTLLPLTQNHVRWMMDSGAFSIYASGSNVRFSDYITFCQYFGPLFWNYVQFDVIRNRQASIDNLNVMEQKGLKPMPVLTLDGQESDVAWMRKINPWICVAGGVTDESQYYTARLERCWRIGEGDQGKVHLHGLGFTRAMEIFPTRVESVDSSSWNLAERWGQIMLFDQLRGFEYARCGFRFQKKFDKLPAPVMRILMRHGIPPDALRWKYGVRNSPSLFSLVNILGWVSYARFAEQKGVHVFLAIGGMSHLISIALLLNHVNGDRFEWEACGRMIPHVRRMATHDLFAFKEYLCHGIEKFYRGQSAVRSVAPVAASAERSLVS